MKHWKLKQDTGWDYDKEERNPPSGKCIILSQEDRVVSVKRARDGRFFITEECDTYYGACYDKAEMLELIDELKAWVESK